MLPNLRKTLPGTDRAAWPARRARTRFPERRTRRAARIRRTADRWRDRRTSAACRHDVGAAVDELFARHPAHGTRRGAPAPTDASRFRRTRRRAPRPVRQRVEGNRGPRARTERGRCRRATADHAAPARAYLVRRVPDRPRSGFLPRELPPGCFAICRTTRRQAHAVLADFFAGLLDGSKASAASPICMRKAAGCLINTQSGSRTALGALLTDIRFVETKCRADLVMDCRATVRSHRRRCNRRRYAEEICGALAAPASGDKTTARRASRTFA